MARTRSIGPSDADVLALRHEVEQLRAECEALRRRLELPPEPGVERPLLREGRAVPPEGPYAQGDKFNAFYRQVAGILDISADAIISADDRGVVRRFNRGAEDIFGYRATEIIGRPLDILIPERFRKAHRGHMAAFAASRDTSRMMNQRGEIAGLRRDGTEFPAEASIAKLDVSGRPILTIILRDITERKLAEAEHRAHAAQIEHAQKLARLGFFVWDDVTGNCLECSPSMAEIFAMPVATFFEKRGTLAAYMSFVHPDDRERVSHAMAQALENKAPYDTEYRCYDDNGVQIHIREIGEPVLDETGRQSRTFGAMQDVTALRRTDQTPCQATGYSS